MHAIKLKAVIDETHKVYLDLPSDTPTGEAEIIVLIDAPQLPIVRSGRSLNEFFDELTRRPILNLRSAEEIEAQIAAERASWD